VVERVGTLGDHLGLWYLLALKVEREHLDLAAKGLAAHLADHVRERASTLVREGSSRSIEVIRAWRASWVTAVSVTGSDLVWTPTSREWPGRPRGHTRGRGLIRREATDAGHCRPSIATLSR
jgi:hypothetical protein